MKKLILMAGLLFSFTLAFSTSSYKVTVNPGINFSEKEKNENNILIEKAVSSFSNQEAFSSDKIKDLLKNEFDETLTKEEDILLDSYTSLLRNLIQTMKYEIKEIKYTKKNEAEVSVALTMPDLDSYVSANEKSLDLQSEKYFKELTGKTVQQVDKDTVNQDKYTPVLYAAYIKAINDDLGKVNKTVTHNLTMKLYNNGKTWYTEEIPMWNFLSGIFY